MFSCVGRTAPATWYGPTAGQAAPERIMIQDLAKFTNPHTIYVRRILSNKITYTTTHYSDHHNNCLTNASLVFLVQQIHRQRQNHQPPT